MSARTWRVPVGSHAISATLDPASGGVHPAPVFVFAHGAGGRMDERGVLALSAIFRAHGLHVLRFNFPYSEARSRRPDPMPVLTATLAAVVESANDHVEASRWIIGGRSMGGRAASMLAADGFACDALLLLAYPLHPAGQPQNLRNAHLSRISVPTLCFNGTRDALCRRDLMESVVARLPGTFTMHWLEGADHSFHVTKASWRSDNDVLVEIGNATQAWIDSLSRHTPIS